MRRVGIRGSCFLIAIFLLARVPAQAQNHQLERLQLALRTRACQPSAEATCGANMQMVRAALKSPSVLWAFVTSPEAGYFERLVAASRAGKLIPASWIPKLLAAQNELKKEELLHEFGVQRYPVNEAGPYFGVPRSRIATQIRRKILGHRFIVPEKWIDYPLTDEELKRSPWPFQVSAALNALRAAIIRDGDPKRNDAVILTLPCKDTETASALVWLTMQVASSQYKTTQDKPYVPPEVFGAWLNVLKNPKTEAARELFVMMLDQASANSECPAGTGIYFCAMAEVLGLEALKKQDRSVIPQIPQFHVYPHSLIVAAARFVLSPEYRQHYSAQDQANDANVLLYITSPTMARDPYPQNLAADDATYQRVVKSFADRFKQWEPFLEREAEVERPLIEHSYKALSTFTTCRP
jgi:hypothetical protein